jgi:plasmid stability protein
MTLDLMSKSKRLQIPDIGEYYLDLLKVEAALKNRSMPQEASSLLCTILQQREEKRRRMVEHLARKRGISTDDMWRQLLDDSYVPIRQDEVDDMADD